MQDDVLMTNPESSESQEFTTLPLLALRDVVVYPQMQIALFVGRAPSVKAVELAQNEFDNKFLYDLGESLESNFKINVGESKEFSDYLFHK